MKKHGGVRIISQIVEDGSFSEEETRLAVEGIGALVFLKSIRDTKEVHETKPSKKRIQHFHQSSFQKKYYLKC